MRVISKARLRQFWEQHRAAEGSLRTWYTHVNSKTVTWHSWAGIKSDYSTASLVGNCVVFNIAGNHYRLVTRVLFASQKVFVLKVMTHAEYDREPWAIECGCYRPPLKPGTKRKKDNRQSRRK